jgi:tellurium resistance protein TerZ
MPKAKSINVLFQKLTLEAIKMINLKKGNSISLEKDGKNLDYVYVGLNWGKIKKYWGLIEEPVDLDGSVTMFDEVGNDLDTVYYRKTKSDDNAVKHSGDDRLGDSYADKKDNEVISIHLKKVKSEVKTIVIYLNSYSGQDFKSIPYANVRLLDGDEISYKNAFANFNLATDRAAKDKVAMVMAKLVRKGNNWQFITIGEGLNTLRIGETVNAIKNYYL